MAKDRDKIWAMPQSLESLLARIAALRDRQAKLAAEQDELLRQMEELMAQQQELKAVVSDECARKSYARPTRPR
jgi:peptidoglycan hydrolase CwlO-like protein